jgi:hypothetical protein
MIVHQYRDLDKNMKIDYNNNSYEMVLSTEDEEESKKGFNHRGILLLKDIIDKIEYHLYDSSIPISYDINEKLDKYYKNGYKVHLYIKSNTNKNNNEKPLNQTGKLHKTMVDGIVKYFINGEDIENFLFKHTEENVYIKIKRIDDVVEDVVNNEGEKKKDEPDRDKEDKS